ncbi:hypothetical protein [Dyadobacter sp. CY312]|uniref:hypothetical protein n=1 Tax=Dyadobacter sp. CY312 TaxID=2907303 RepID=UPI001F4237A2|nr:hypothetical protein [Dyadobacter sp. CY312]MCE7044406.1 hypothetical protein [Dyadobacter sp. CY312]
MSIQKKLAFKAYTMNGDVYLLKDKNTFKDPSNSLPMQERLDLPTYSQKKINEAGLKEYNQRFIVYEARKQISPNEYH